MFFSLRCGFAAPPAISLNDTLYVPHAEAITNTLAPCEANPTCSEAYPDITQRFWDLVEALEETPIVADDTGINGQDLFSIFSAAGNDWSDPTTRGVSTHAPAFVCKLEDEDVFMLNEPLQGDILQQPTAESVLAGASGLSSDERALVEVFVNPLAQRELRSETAAHMLVQLETDLDTDAAPATLGDYFDDELERALETVPESTDQVVFAQDYLNFRFATPSAAALRQLVRDHFDNPVAAHLTSMIAMPDQDVF